MDEKVNFNFSENFFAMKKLSLIIFNIVKDIDIQLKCKENRCNYFARKSHAQQMLVFLILYIYLKNKLRG